MSFTAKITYQENIDPKAVYDSIEDYVKDNYPGEYIKDDQNITGRRYQPKWNSIGEFIEQGDAYVNFVRLDDARHFQETVNNHIQGIDSIILLDFYEDLYNSDQQQSYFPKTEPQKKKWWQKFCFCKKRK